MADPTQLQDAAAWLLGQLQSSQSQVVTYRRGVLSVGFNATFGSSLLKTTDASGRVKIERTARDFLFPAAKLDFGAGPVTPQRGDTVDIVVGGATERYEVMAPGKEPVYRYADPYKTILRVHSRFQTTA